MWLWAGGREGGWERKTIYRDSEEWGEIDHKDRWFTNLELWFESVENSGSTPTIISIRLSNVIRTRYLLFCLANIVM